MSTSRESGKDSFLLYLGHEKLFARLDDKGRSELIMGIFEYARNGTELSSENPAVEMAFVSIQDDLDRNAKKYEQQCQRNRENGKLGGRPKGNPQEPRKPSGFLDNPYEYDYENDTDNSEIKNNVQRSEPETVSKPVTEPTVDEADTLFEELWRVYPQKRGKGSISKTAKNKLLKYGKEQMLRAIDRYVSECKAQGRYYKNGSTFFNSGYLDYLDDTYAPLDKSPQKSNALDDWTREQKAKKAEDMRGQQRGTDYDAMIAQSVISDYTRR